MKPGLIVSVILLCASTYAQVDSLVQLEGELVVLLDGLRTAKDDASKKEKNEVFRAALKDVLDRPESMDYSFSELGTVGFINSPDGLARIVNWNVEQDDKSQRYFCFVQHFDKRKKKYYVTELTENVFGVKEPEGIVASDDWYGALYYRIIPVKKGRRTVYTILGWDGNTNLTNSKLIDAMYFTGSTVKFGSPIFKIGSEIKHRLFYEHSEKCTMSLNYEEDRKRIMMDHLAPEAPSLAAFPSFYCPDLSYDALKFEDEKWVLYEDVIGVNPESEKDQYVTVMDPKTGELVQKKMNSDWQDPSDANAPAGGSVHVAVLPDADGNATSAEPKEKKKIRLFRSRDKRDPSDMSVTIEGNKKRRKRKHR